MYFTLVGGYIAILSLVLFHSSLYTQRGSSHWARCLKAQTLLPNLDIMVSMPWKFMLVDVFHVPSGLCLKEGGGLARGYRHTVERDCRGASVKGRSWSRLRRKMCPSTKTKADTYYRVSVQIYRGQQIPSKEIKSKARCVGRQKGESLLGSLHGQLTREGKAHKAMVYLPTAPRNTKTQELMTARLLLRMNYNYISFQVFIAGIPQSSSPAALEAACPNGP